MSAFEITLAVILLTTVIGTIVQRRSKDACLKRLRRHHIYIQLKNGKWIWGQLEVYSQSLELVYDKPHRDRDGHGEMSYAFFEPDMTQIQIVVRPLPLPGTEQLHRWQREFERIITPSVWAEIRRPIRNVYNTTRDVLSQTIGIAVGQLRARNPTAMLGPADQKIAATGQMLMSVGANAYEPVLERYLGKEVVAEILMGEKWIELVGVLEEYTDKFLLIRDVELPTTMQPPEPANGRRVDLALPRGHSVVRHLGSRKTPDAKT